MEQNNPPQEAATDTTTKDHFDPVHVEFVRRKKLQYSYGIGERFMDILTIRHSPPHFLSMIDPSTSVGRKTWLEAAARAYWRHNIRTTSEARNLNFIAQEEGPPKKKLKAVSPSKQPANAEFKLADGDVMDPLVKEAAMPTPGVQIQHDGDPLEVDYRKEMWRDTLDDLADNVSF